MTRLIYIFISLFLLAGCYNNPDVLKPMPWIFNQMPKDAPNNYKRGWKDGCESGLSTMTNSLYRKFYSFRQDNSLRNNTSYYKTWQDSFQFCRSYAYGTLRESNQRMGLQPHMTGFTGSYIGTGIFEAGPLQLEGPGGNALVPFEHIGSIGGDPYVGVGNSARQVIGGVSTLDYSHDTMFGNMDGGWTLDYSHIPFFEH
jgi:hypothetical protein